jgi:hypothetical protein
VRAPRVDAVAVLEQLVLDVHGEGIHRMAFQSL